MQFMGLLKQGLVERTYRGGQNLILSQSFNFTKGIEKNEQL